MTEPVIQWRSGQKNFLRLARKYRRLGLVARRRFGKTTLMAGIALEQMIKRRDHTIIFGSVKLDLAREIVRSESMILQKAIQAARDSLAGDAARMQVIDSNTHKTPDKLTADDFADLYEQQRLEFRYYHTRSSYSRTKVIALTPNAVGEGGTLIADEIGRIRNWREVEEAITPIVQANPKLNVFYCTTPPPDDKHASYEQLSPPVGMEFTPNPEGTLYRSETGLRVLRVDAWDAYADGYPVFDEDSGEPLTPDQSRAKARDKDAWDRNYGCKFIVGGSAACGLVQLNTAQTRGIGKCALIVVDEDTDFLRGLAHLKANLGAGKIGLGFDVATTTRALSNPSSLTVCERNGAEIAAPVILVWKTKDPAVATERIIQVVDAIAARREGGRARELAIDASNEKYFAASLRRKLSGRVPVRMVVSGESLEKPGMEPTNWKTFLGDQLVGALNDNQLTLPPERYLKEDWRMIVKEKGVFVCDPDENGRHGDTFDSTKLAIQALTGSGTTAPRAFTKTRTARAIASRRNREIYA